MMSYSQVIKGGTEAEPVTSTSVTQ